MTDPSCTVCGRILLPGETAWRSDWKVIDTSGQRATIRMETRYTCNECERVDRSS